MKSRINSEPKPGPDTVTGLTVLLVDDEDGIRAYAAHVLRRRGYIVIEAKDGMEALELAGRRHGPIHLLLTDWRMPRLDGRELIGCLSTKRPETAAILMSSFFDVVAPAGVTLLSKPFTPVELVRTVQEVLQLSRQASAAGTTFGLVPAALPVIEITVEDDPDGTAIENTLSN